VKADIISILLVATLALIPYLPVVAQDDSTGTITITMIGLPEISITLSQTEWKPAGEGTVSPNAEYKTGGTEAAVPTWCILTNAGNVNINTFIVGEDATCMDKPTYTWALSSDGTIGNRKYGLWFIFEGANYVPIAKTLGEFQPHPGASGEDMGVGDSRNFGLKLLTPEPDFYDDKGVGYFSVGSAAMKTTITISAVAA
jgi:hypothetical protein